MPGISALSCKACLFLFWGSQALVRYYELVADQLLRARTFVYYCLSDCFLDEIIQTLSCKHCLFLFLWCQAIVRYYELVAVQLLRARAAQETSKQQRPRHLQTMIFLEFCIFTKFPWFEISFINKNGAHVCIHSNTVGIFLEFCRRLYTILELDRSFQKKPSFLPNTAKRTHNIRGTNCSTVLIWLLYSHVRLSCLCAWLWCVFLIAFDAYESKVEWVAV